MEYFVEGGLGRLPLLSYKCDYPMNGSQERSKRRTNRQTISDWPYSCDHICQVYLPLHSERRLLWFQKMAEHDCCRLRMVCTAYLGYYLQYQNVVAAQAIVWD